MKRRLAQLLALAFPLLMTGCGSSGNSAKNAVAASGISGNWEMSLQKGNSTLAPKTQSGFLVQNGSDVTGSVIFTDIPCSGIGSVTGTVSGSAISLVTDPTGTSVNLTGTVASDNASMSGTYEILSAGCSGTQTAPQSGAWTANLVQPVSGSFQGTISSKKLGSFAVTAQATQGANTGLSNTTLTGSLNFTGYCIASANIVGAVSGTSVAINLVAADGTQFGQVNATSSLDGTTLSGTYALLDQPKPCGSGDNGTLTLTHQ